MGSSLFVALKDLLIARGQGDQKEVLFFPSFCLLTEVIVMGRGYLLGYLGESRP